MTFKRGDIVADTDNVTYIFSHYLNEKMSVVGVESGVDISFFIIESETLVQSKNSFKKNVNEDYRFGNFYFEKEVLDANDKFFRDFINKNKDSILYYYLNLYSTKIERFEIKEIHYIGLFQISNMEIMRLGNDTSFNGYGLLLNVNYTYFSDPKNNLLARFIFPVWLDDGEVDHITKTFTDFSKDVSNFIFPIDPKMILSDEFDLKRKSGKEGVYDKIELKRV